jgi:putative glutamine amidotransferase
MKRSVVSTVLIGLLLSSASLDAQQYFNSINAQKKEKDILVLTHPTVYNLKTFMSLIEYELIDLVDYQLVGVYYQKERYDYSKTDAFLDTANGLPLPVHLHQVKDTLETNSLYTKNPLSDDFSTIFKLSNGIIFFGGPDMPPSTYGEKTNLLTSVYDPQRHYFELSFLYHLLGGKQNPDYKGLMTDDQDYLVYGFCLGMQSMNVATGGTLVQDIPSVLYDLRYAEAVIAQDINKKHRNYQRVISIDDALLNGNFHQIHFVTDSYLKSFSKEQILPAVYSNHHQAVKTLGKGFEKIATSLDEKVPEAIQHKKYKNVKGVQFHPEAKLLYDPSIKFKLTPEDTSFNTGVEMLEEASSKEFHEAFWKDFSKRLNEQ